MKLSAVVVLYRLKSTNGWSDEGFNKLMEVLHDMLPMDNVMINSVYNVKKFLNSFELGDEKIHACEQDCCLFGNENAEMDCCPKCGTSRWKVDLRTKKIRKGFLPKCRDIFL